MPRVARSPRNSVNDRPSRWKLLLRRQRRLVRPVAWTLTGLAVLALVVVVAKSAAPGGTLVTLRERLGGMTGVTGLRVTDVKIEGRQNTPEPLLMAAVGVSKGDPILGFSVEQARRRIETLSWIEQATVERRLPGTVVVFLQERRPFAVWQKQGKYVLVDREGKDVDNQDFAQFRHLPLIVGPGAPANAAVLMDELAKQPAIAGRVTASVRVAERRWNLRMNNGTDVMLPEGHVREALERLAQLQRDHAVLDRPLAAIDLRLPDRLVLRPRSESRSDAAASGGTTPTAPVTPAMATTKKPT